MSNFGDYNQDNPYEYSDSDSGYTHDSDGSGGSLITGTIGGIVTATACSVIWAVITIVSGHQFAILAIGIGFLIAMAIVAFSGKNANPTTGIIAGVLALLSIVFGNLIHLAVELSNFSGTPGSDMDKLSYFESLGIILKNPSFALGLLKETFQPIDVLFYAIAVWVGFRTASGGGGSES